MSSSARVRYRERQRLRTADLQDEQNYLLGLDGRHNVGPHDWGIVRGLQIRIDEKTRIATLFPGVAIDAYGRELVVAQSVPLDLKPDIATHNVYLFYCERPRGKCGDRSNPRWNDSIAIAVSEDRLPLPDEPAASLARAAGSLPDEPLWPVLLGVVTAGNPPSVNISEVRYTRLHAGPVRHSTGRTVMRVGQESLIDPYHFLVTSSREGGATENRLAIDRDGNLQFWKDVIVESASKSAPPVRASRSATVASPIPDVNIKSQAKPGSNVQVQTSTITKGPNQFLQLLFQGKTAKGELVSEELLLNSNIRKIDTLDAKLSTFSDDSKLVTLTSKDLSTKKPSTPASEQAHSTSSAKSGSSSVVDDLPLRLEFGAATIRFKLRQEVGKREFCGCVDQDEKAGGLPEGLVFHPGPNPPAIPSKDIYCIRISKPNVTPVDNLRIVGGLLRKGDLNQRIVVGDTNNQTGPLNVFRPWLAFRGNGAIRIFGGNLNFAQLYVTGITELAPVKPDPRDPVFNALSVLAFINGVLSLGVQLLTLTITDVPDFIETAQPWSYKLTIKNESNEDLTAVPGNSEVITAGTGAQIFFRVISGVNPLGAKATSDPLSVQHSPDPPDSLKLDPTTTEITIEVAIAMRGRITVGGSKKRKVPVVRSPEIDFSAIPDSVILTSPAEAFPIKIKNRSIQTISITNVQATGAAIISVPTFPLDLGPNLDLDLDVTLIPDASPPLTTVSIEISYIWENDLTSQVRTLTQSKEVDVH